MCSGGVGRLAPRGMFWRECLIFGHTVVEAQHTQGASAAAQSNVVKGRIRPGPVLTVCTHQDYTGFDLF